MNSNITIARNAAASWLMNCNRLGNGREDAVGGGTGRPCPVRRLRETFRGQRSIKHLGRLDNPRPMKALKVEPPYKADAGFCSGLPWGMPNVHNPVDRRGPRVVTHEITALPERRIT